MKNGIEVRANGAVIIKTQRKGGAPQYHVTGSDNGPWDLLRNARKDARNHGQSSSFQAGFRSGVTWDKEYRPGGPYVYNEETQKANDEWHLGFYVALTWRGVFL